MYMTKFSIFYEKTIDIVLYIKRNFE